ncbi:MAG: hypothetical protein AAF414_23830 [Pseudomonadota bacterium]
MDVKTFRSAGIHQRGGPLLWPHANLAEFAFALASEFPKIAALSLLKHSAFENLNARDPDLLQPLFAQQFTGLDLTLFQSDGIDLFVGDVFDLTADALGHVDAIYDRAALVALPHEMRVDYAAHIATITGSARQLLLTFVYDQAEMDGPPFAVDGDGVDALYGAWYRRKLGAGKPITGSLAERCTGTESAWLLEPLGQSS